jgi:HPt (histidine-containing phosphotransfer) domain-containing protein
MAKAVAYLGDAANAQQLLVTLQSTLETEIPKIQDAISAQNFEILQKILHQLKGFAPVFCHDALVAEINRTEGLCKHIDNPDLQAAALQASAALLSNLKLLKLEVQKQLAA